MTLGYSSAVRLWLNGAQCFVAKDAEAKKGATEARIEAVARQGRNTLLLKISTGGAPSPIRVDLFSSEGPLDVSWWK